MSQWSRLTYPYESGVLHIRWWRGGSDKQPDVAALLDAARAELGHLEPRFVTARLRRDLLDNGFQMAGVLYDPKGNVGDGRKRLIGAQRVLPEALQRNLKPTEVRKRTAKLIRIKQLTEAGYSPSQIAKETGWSYSWVSRMVEWTKEEEEQ